MDEIGNDPFAARIRDRRASRGLSLRALAARASQETIATASGFGVGTAVSPSYLSLIENGHKVPNAAIARAIAAALEDDPALYEAWVATRKRADLATAVAAARVLSNLFDRPAASAPRTRTATGPATRLRVPVIREGDDPGESMRPSCGIDSWLRVDLRDLDDAQRERLDRPVAWRVERDALHLPDLFPRGAVALVLRNFLPLAAGAAYAMRTDERVALRRLLWNGRQLVALPPPGSHDFEVIEAPDARALRARVLGLAIRVEGVGA